MSKGTKQIRAGRFLELARQMEQQATNYEQLAAESAAANPTYTVRVFAKAEADREAAGAIRLLCEFAPEGGER